MSWTQVFAYLRSSGFERWAEQLEQESSDWLIHHGDYNRWSAALEALPEINRPNFHFDRAEVTIEGHCDELRNLEQTLKQLIPWRKGPYRIADIGVDCEWRSDFKWDRVRPHLSSLKNARILDVGCGNGYHCWRMLAESPEFVLGIEPSVLFNMQFQALQRYIQREDIGLLPIGVEALPEKLELFDNVFSMGILYHRKSPIDHLYQLKDCLVSGGELCLETLVIEGGAGQVLVPPDRYARMRNVWFIPSVAELVIWLQRCGFGEIRVVDESTTTLDEQRVTDWMQFESLQQCLDPDNPGLTVEGLPAPRRAVVLARKPRN